MRHDPFIELVHIASSVWLTDGFTMRVVARQAVDLDQKKMNCQNDRHKKTGWNRFFLAIYSDVQLFNRP